ncbi:MAG: phenylacetate--CoA ligase family protein, partial [Bacilli bacterium]
MLKDIFEISQYKINKMLRTIYYSIPDRIKRGVNFNQTYKMLNKSQYWDAKKHVEYQNYQLKKLVSHAYNTVPYYNKLFNSIGIKPNDINDYNDLKKIPYLSKEIIQNNRDELISTKYKKDSL